MGRDVNRAVLARFVTNTGAEAGFFIGMWGKAAFQFEAGPTALAVMTVLIASMSVVGNLVGGVAVDRTDARRVLVAAEVVLIPFVLALILAESLVTLFAIGAVVFLLHGVEETAATSLPPALVPAGDEDRLVSVNARLESAGWLAMVAGPALGGMLAGLVDVDAVFVFDALTSAVSIAILAGVHLVPRPEASVDEPAEQESGLAEVRLGLAIARRTPPIAFSIFLGSVLWLSFGAFIALEPLYFRDVLGVGPDVLGYVNAWFGLGLFAGSTIIDRWGRGLGFRHAVLLAAASGLGAIGYVGSDQLRIVLVGAVCWSVPLGMFLPILRTLAQRSAPEGAVGRVMGTVATVQNLTSVLPAVFVPWLAATFGVQRVLVGGGVLPLLVAPFLLARAGRLDRSAPDEPLDIQPDPTPDLTPLP